MDNASEILKDDDLLEPWDWDIQEDGLWIPPSMQAKVKNIDDFLKKFIPEYHALEKSDAAEH